MRELVQQWSGTRRQIGAVVLAIVVIYVALNMVGLAVHVVTLMQEEGALHQTLADLDREEASLLEDIRYMLTDSFIEKAAREILLWVKPNERLVIIVGGQPDQAPRMTPTPARGR